jgi:hypothetical protein
MSQVYDDAKQPDITLLCTEMKNGGGGGELTKVMAPKPGRNCNNIFCILEIKLLI